MKQAASILLLTLYTFLNLGLVVNTHYCGGKITSISLSNTIEKNCGICGKKQMDKKCCQDTQTQLSVDDNQINSHVQFNFLDYSYIFPPVINYNIQVNEYVFNDENSGRFYPFETGPPKTPLFIKNCALII